MLHNSCCLLLTVMLPDPLAWDEVASAGSRVAATLGLLMILLRASGSLNVPPRDLSAPFQNNRNKHQERFFVWAEREKGT